MDPDRPADFVLASATGEATIVPGSSTEEIERERLRLLAALQQSTGQPVNVHDMSDDELQDYALNVMARDDYNPKVIKVVTPSAPQDASPQQLLDSGRCPKCGAPSTSLIRSRLAPERPSGFPREGRAVRPRGSDPGRVGLDAGRDMSDAPWPEVGDLAQFSSRDGTWRFIVTEKWTQNDMTFYGGIPDPEDEPEDAT